jgi:hypothetical protein
LLAHGRWFSPGTPASSTTIAESGVKTSKIKSKSSLDLNENGWLVNIMPEIAFQNKVGTNQMLCKRRNCYVFHNTKY